MKVDSEFNEYARKHGLPELSGTMNIVLWLDSIFEIVLHRMADMEAQIRALKEKTGDDGK